MVENFRTRQNRCSLFLDFRPENGINVCRKWDGFRRMRRMGETAMGRWGDGAEARVHGGGETRACAAAAVASSRRD
jgi:hypothetical protein